MMVPPTIRHSCLVSLARMRWLPSVLLFLAVALKQTCASGLMEIHLKSAHNQKATVILSDGSDPTYIALPIILQKDVEMKFGDLLIDFSKTYTVTIVVDETAALGLKSSTYQGKISPISGTVSPSKLNLPLTGIRFDFKCDPNYSGEKCNISCETGDCSTAQIEKIVEMEFDVDYTVNPLKMESLVAMLKKENEIENTFTSRRPVHRKIAEKIDLTAGLPPIATSEGSDSGLLTEKETSADEQLHEFLGGSGEFPEQITLRFLQ